MKKDIEIILVEALKLKNDGEYHKAISLLTVYDLIGDCNKVTFLLAALYFLTDSFEKSSKYYERLLPFYPSSELISTGLFQSYWNCGDFNNAYLELDRFLSVNVPVDTYLVILKEHFSLITGKTPESEKEILIKYCNMYLNNN